MRRFLMWMMICLLPLRLWAGDAMAVQHAPPAAHMVAVEVAVDVAAQDAHPCHGSEGPAASDMHHSPADNSAHGGACGDCSVCHGPLAGLAVPAWTAPALPGAVPQTVGWPALSANAPPHLKPPRA